MFCFLTVYLEFTWIYVIQCMVLQAFYILLDFSEELINYDLREELITFNQVFS